MEPKLQQAIVATRAGRTDIAQNLLAQLINEHPDDPNAWFLLSHLVESPDRQRRYLNKVLQIDPKHELAQKRMAEMPGSPVPAPVIQGEVSGVSIEKIEDVEEVQITPSTPILQEAVAAEQMQAEKEGDLPEWLQDLEQVKLGEQKKSQAIDEEWTKTAGPPKRVTSTNSSQPDTGRTTNSGVSGKRSKGDTWLIRILLIMVLVAFIVLGFLIILLFI